jgi:hypothetical protein
VEFEKEVANFHQSLGITCGPGDIHYRLIILVLAQNKTTKITRFSEIREYTDQVADRGSIGSKMKNIFQLHGLVKKVEHGGYIITENGLIAAEFIKDSSENYKAIKKTKKMLERIP